MNSLKTALLLGLLSGVLLFGGELIGGRTGLEYGLVLAVGMNFFSYFFSDKLALMRYSAQPVTPQDNPEVYARVVAAGQSLAQRMGMPMPKLWLIPGRFAERVRHRTQSQARFGRVHAGNFAVDDRP